MIKKAAIISIFLLASSAISFAAELLGCYNDKTGLVRIVESHKACLPDEFPVSSADVYSVEKANGSIVTGDVLFFDPIEYGYCPTYTNGVPIVSEKHFYAYGRPRKSNTTRTGYQFDDVFEIVCLSDRYIRPETGKEGIKWGLRCKEENGWKSIGCKTMSGGDETVAFNCVDNGCFADDGSYAKTHISTTCVNSGW